MYKISKVLKLFKNFYKLYRNYIIILFILLIFFISIYLINTNFKKESAESVEYFDENIENDQINYVFYKGLSLTNNYISNPEESNNFLKNYSNEIKIIHSEINDKNYENAIIKIIPVSIISTYLNDDPIESINNIISSVEDNDTEKKTAAIISTYVVGMLLSKKIINEFNSDSTLVEKCNNKNKDAFLCDEIINKLKNMINNIINNAKKENGLIYTYNIFDINCSFLSIAIAIGIIIANTNLHSDLVSIANLVKKVVSEVVPNETILLIYSYQNIVINIAISYAISILSLYQNSGNLSAAISAADIILSDSSLNVSQYNISENISINQNIKLLIKNIYSAIPLLKENKTSAKLVTGIDTW
jgi:hypothetical protein